jgi:hypothetical protein
VWHEIVEGRTADRLLQAVDAAEPTIVEQYNRERQAHRHRRGDLAVHQQVAAIADHDDHRPRRIGHLDAKPAGDLVAHAGIAILQLVRPRPLGAP